MVFPVLPLMAPKIMGATPMLVGLAIGIYGLSQAALQIPFGFLSDQFGRKKIIAIGLVLFILGSLLSGFAVDIYMLILGRFLQGCGAIAGALLALVSDLTRVEQRAKAMAIVGISIAGAFGLSLVVGPLVANSIGLSGIFFLTAALGCLALLILFVQIPTPDIMSVNLDASVQRGTLGIVLGNFSLWKANSSVFVLHYLLVSLFTALPVVLMNAGVTDIADHSLHYLVSLLFSLIFVLPFLWLSEQLRPNRGVFAVMVSLCIVSFYLIGDMGSYWWIIVGATLFFVSFNFLEVTLPAQLSRIAGAGTRGSAMGVYTTCQFLGIFAGGAISGWILSIGNIATLMFFDVGIAVFWLLFCLTFPLPRAVASRTIILGEVSHLDANEQVEGLLSVTGVIDVVIINQEQVAYLKVDEETFREESINEWVRAEDT